MEKEITGIIESIVLQYTNTGKLLCKMYINKQCIVVWESLAEKCVKEFELQEGDSVKIIGYEKEEKWKIPSGELKSKIIIVAKEVEKVNN